MRPRHPPGNHEPVRQPVTDDHPARCSARGAVPARPTRRRTQGDLWVAARRLWVSGLGRRGAACRDRSPAHRRGAGDAIGAGLVATGDRGSRAGAHHDGPSGSRARRHRCHESHRGHRGPAPHRPGGRAGSAARAGHHGPGAAPGGRSGRLGPDGQERRRDRAGARGHRCHRTRLAGGHRGVVGAACPAVRPDTASRGVRTPRRWSGRTGRGPACRARERGSHPLGCGRGAQGSPDRGGCTGRQGRQQLIRQSGHGHRRHREHIRERQGDAGLMASDLLVEIPRVRRELQRQRSSGDRRIGFAPR